MIIARSAVECAINLAFMLAQGESAAIRANDYALQKWYRERTQSWGPFTEQMKGMIEPPPAIQSIPGLEQALRTFTDRRGREIPKWTPKSRPERIDVAASTLGRHVGTCLHAANLIIYSSASEMVHGTQAGAVRLFGLSPRRVGDGGRELDDATTLGHLDIVTAGHRHDILCGTGFAALGALGALMAKAGDTEYAAEIRRRSDGMVAAARECDANAIRQRLARGRAG
jgi:hypothetical protein